MAAHTATHHDKDQDDDRDTEKERISNADALRRSPVLANKLRPVDTFEALERHQKEVEEDEKARTKAFEDSPRFKRIEQRQKASEKDAKDAKDPSSKEILTEEDAKTRATTFPVVEDDGSIKLPKGAALPPAVLEPRNPAARAWDVPLSEPAE